MTTGKDFAPEYLSHSGQFVSPQQRMAMALRIHQTVEREMDAIERILSTIKPSIPIEAELGARTVVGVSRALREIRALNSPEDEMPPDDADPISGDIHAFREALAQRLKAFIVAERASEGACDADDGERMRSAPAG